MCTCVFLIGLILTGIHRVHTFGYLPKIGRIQHYVHQLFLHRFVSHLWYKRWHIYVFCPSWFLHKSFCRHLTQWLLKPTVGGKKQKQEYILSVLTTPKIYAVMYVCINFMYYVYIYTICGTPNPQKGRVTSFARFWQLSKYVSVGWWACTIAATHHWLNYS